MSDSPITVDPERLESSLHDYWIDGKAVFDLANSLDSARFHQLVATTQHFNTDDSFDRPSMEYADSMHARCRGSRIMCSRGQFDCSIVIDADAKQMRRRVDDLGKIAVAVKIEAIM